MMSNKLSEYVQGEDLEYVRNFLNASNKGYSNNFIGGEVIVDLILALRDTNARLRDLEDSNGCKES